MSQFSLQYQKVQEASRALAGSEPGHQHRRVSGGWRMAWAALPLPPGRLSGSGAPPSVPIDLTAPSPGLSSSWSRLLYAWRLWASCPPLPRPSFLRKGCTRPPQHLAQLPAHGRCPSPRSMDLDGSRYPVSLCVLPGAPQPRAGWAGCAPHPHPGAVCAPWAPGRRSWEQREEGLGGQAWRSLQHGRPPEFP